MQASGFPLSDNGRNQANLAGIALKDTRFDQIYSSEYEKNVSLRNPRLKPFRETRNTNNEKSNGIKEKHHNCRFLIATHAGWIMRFIRFMNQFRITDPDSHCEEVKDYGSLFSGKSIANTAIFTFDLVVDGENCEILSYNCTKCNSFEHLTCSE